MERNFRIFLAKSASLVVILFAVVFIFRFPIEYLGISTLGLNRATTLFSKSDALKITALAILFFALYYRSQISRISHKKINKFSTLFYFLTGFLFVSSYYALKYFVNNSRIESGPVFYLSAALSFIVLLGAFASFAAGIFSAEYLRTLYLKLKIPVWITAAATAGAYFLLAMFQNLWPYFSYSISVILFDLFNPIYPTYLELGTAPFLDVNGFAVSIGAACSGIESLFLFAVFSIGIYTLDHRKLRKKTFVISSLLGLAGIYFVNIIRLFLLILVGIYTSPQFAVGIFHTNVGWILFVVYFLVYYTLTKDFIYKAHENGTKKILAR